MKKAFINSLLSMCLCVFTFAPHITFAQEFSDEVMARMGIFLSNFTEMGMYDFTADEVLDEDNPAAMIQFGIVHNYMNNYNSRIVERDGMLVIDDDYVKESINKYFDYEIQNLQSVDFFEYDGYVFTFDGFGGEAIYYARVEEAETLEDGTIQMEGYLYNIDDETDRLGTYVALAEPHRFNNVDTWSIISMDWTE